jgi:hypothetical protein
MMPPKKWEAMAEIMRKAGRKVTSAELVALSGLSLAHVHGHLETIKKKGFLESHVGQGNVGLYWLIEGKKIPEREKPKSVNRINYKPHPGEGAVEFAIRLKKIRTNCDWLGL